MASTAPRPTEDCPKCGDNLWLGPTYQPERQQTLVGTDPNVVPEALVWRCNTCGATVMKPTMDAQPERKRK